MHPLYLKESIVPKLQGQLQKKLLCMFVFSGDYVMFMILSDLRKQFRFSEVETDNFVFRLHYRFSVAFLSIIIILVGSKQFFGDAIHCRASYFSPSFQNIVATNVDLSRPKPSTTPR